jgi:hypothetical protein
VSQQMYGAPMAPPPVDRIIVGQLAGVEQRNGGFVRFSIAEQGNQYPTTCDTRQPEMIGQAMSLMGQVVTVEIREQTSTKINERSGKPYVNRYLNKIALGVGTLTAPVPQQQASQAPAQQQFVPAPQQPPQAPQQAFTPQPGQPSSWEQTKDLKISRIAASKNACAMLAAGLVPEDLNNIEGLVALSESWVAYFTYGPSRFGVRAFDQAPVHNAPAHNDGPVDSNVNNGDVPCVGCGAAPGQLHAEDCVPF